jgi:hypothetical protein
MKWRGTVIAIAILASLPSCKPAHEPVGMSPALIGVWETDDPRYVDRYFELTGDTITLARGEAGKDSYPIERLEKQTNRRGASYVLTYRNPVERVGDTLSFEYEPREGGAIRFKNQRRIVWKKAPRP